MRLCNIRAVRAGFTMVEVLGALVVMAILWQSLAWLWQKGPTELRKRAVAEHFVAITAAVEKYLKQNHDTLLDESTATTGPVISPAALRAAQCLSNQIRDMNAWGQSYLITTRRTANGDLAAAILTTGGRGVSSTDPAFAQIVVPETAALIRAGFIPVNPHTVLRGPYGSWEIALAGMGLTGDPGHLGLVATLDSRDLKQDYVYRVAVPGHPELNAMHTELDMTDHALRGVREVQYKPHPFNTMTDFCDTAADEGRTFLDPDNGLYLCRQGEIRVISDTGNTLSMQNATLAVDGQVIAKPVCPAGSKTHPEIFVMPSIGASATNTADAAKVKPMHSFQAWATSLDDAGWQVRMRILNSDNTWVYPTADYGRMMVFTSCVRD